MANSDGIAAQQGELLRLAQQRQQAVAEQVGGGLEAGGEEQRGERDQLVVRQPIAADLRRGQVAQQILARLAALLRDQLQEVGADGELRGVGRRHLLGGRLHLEDRHQIAHQLAELRPIRLRHAEHLADDRHRQREADGFEHVAAAGLGHRIEQLVDDAAR